MTARASYITSVQSAALTQAASNDTAERVFQAAGGTQAAGVIRNLSRTAAEAVKQASIQVAKDTLRANATTDLDPF